MDLPQSDPPAGSTRQLGLRPRLALGFGCLLALLVVLGVQGVSKLDELGNAIDVMLRENYRSVQACQQMTESLERLDSAALFALSGEAARGRDLVATHRATFEAALDVESHNDTLPGEFVTLFYGVLDTHNRRLTYCNAGHPPGLLLRAGKLIELGSDNMVLGVDPAERYTQSIIELQSEDLLLLYTDGLPDAMNFQQQTYGRQRLVDVFMRGGETAEQVAQNLLWDMRRFAGLTKRTDDVTMIVVNVK